MATYRIPDIYVNGFVQLAALPVTQANIIAKELKTAKVGEGPQSVTKRINLEEIDFESVSSICISIFSLINIYNKSEGLEEFVEDFSNSFNRKLEQAKIDHNKTTKDGFKRNLKIILKNIKQIKISFKARELLMDNHNIYRESKIISDIRLVLDDDLNSANQSALVVHQLKINYFQNGNNQDIYLALDEDDLINLRKNIERALEKETYIRSKKYNNNLEFIKLSD